MEMLFLNILLLKWPKIRGRSTNRGVKGNVDVLDESLAAAF